MKRTGSIASAGVLVSAGLFGAYVGNPRLQRAYAIPSAPGSDCNNPYPVTVEDSFINALDDSSIVCIQVSGPVTLTRSLPTVVDDSWVGGLRDDSGLTIQGDGGGDDSIGGAGTYSGIAIDVTDPNMELTISNLTMNDFTASSRGGSALYVKRRSGTGALVVNLTDDTFVDNSSTNNPGGSAYIFGDDTTTTLVDISSSVFTNNSSASDGGALRAKSTWGAARVLLEGSTFTNNHGGSGGAVKVTGPAEAYVSSTESTFIGNSAQQDGGAINAYDVHITGDTQFISNSSINSGGGAIRARRGEILQATFQGNTAGHYGGGIYVFAPPPQNASLTVDGALFENNGAYSGGGMAFVGRQSDDSLSVSNSTFHRNSAERAGGSIYSSGTLIVGHSLLSDDTTGTPGTSGYGYGGGIYAPYIPGATVTVSYTTISGSEALESGGGLFSKVPTTLTYSSIIDNTSGSRGGGIYAYDQPLTLRNTYVGGNTSVYEGGGIYTAVDGDLTLLFSTVYDDTTQTPWSATASEVFVKGSLYARASTVGHPTSDSAMYVADGIDSVDSISTYSTPQPPAILDDSVNFDDSVTPGSLGLTRDDTSVPGRTGASPSGNSPLVLRAADDSLGVLPLSLDQWQIARSNFPTYTIGARQFATTPTPPDPPAPPGPPLDPPSEPRAVVAVAGDRRVTVSWSPPAQSGSYPITDYKAVSQPGGKTCLVKAPATTCTVTGLSNGTPYTFTVAALNGAGWGAPSTPSAPVTPSAPPLVRIVLDQGIRIADGKRDRIVTAGATGGIDPGTRLTPWIRYNGQTSFTQGKATITVQSDGTFRWSRQIRKGKGLTAYVSYVDTESNRVLWAPAHRAADS